MAQRLAMVAACFRHHAVKLAVLSLAAGPLVACGFQPLYGSRNGEIAPEADLRQIYVASIPDRYGQMLRLALQEDMSGAGPEDPQKYTLVVSSYVAQEAVDIHSDNTSGRMRATGHAHWSLRTVAESPKTLAEGDASTMDGMNNTFEQYFAQSMNTDALQARVAKTLGETITMQVATWLRTHAPPPVHQKPLQAYYPVQNGIPQSSQRQPMQASGEDGLPDMATGRSPTIPDDIDSDDTAPGSAASSGSTQDSGDQN